MKRIPFLIILFLIAFNQNIAQINKKYFNIIIVSDLSDRNLADKVNLPKYPLNYDLLVIDMLLDRFKNNVKRNLYVNSKDRISLIAIPQIESLTFDKERNLMIDISQMDIRERRMKLNSVIENFKNTVEEIYYDGLKRKTIGADIWSFFKYDLKKYIIEDDRFMNVLVLLTDGYMYFNDEYKGNRTFSKDGSTVMEIDKLRNMKEVRNKKYKILEIGNKFKSLNILLMGIDPVIKYSTKEFELVKSLWSEWFKSMNVRSYKILKLNKSEISVKMDIEDFLKR